MSGSIIADRRIFYAQVPHYGAWVVLLEVGIVSEQDIARLQEQIKTLFGDVNELKEDVKEIKQQLANRLPLWATVLISALTGAIGWLIR